MAGVCSTVFCQGLYDERLGLIETIFGLLRLQPAAALPARTQKSQPHFIVAMRPLLMLNF